jgi:hypothetical protein
MVGLFVGIWPPLGELTSRYRKPAILSPAPTASSSDIGAITRLR